MKGEAMLRKSIVVNGLVQGVGFRPFVYKIAVENNLKGFIKNSSIGVIIDIEGHKSSVETFIHDLQSKGPELLHIEKIIINDKELVNYKGFEIRESSDENQGITFISPDLGICNDCYQDIQNKKNNRYLYAFTNCTNCGPRYSITQKLPYDRISTTMKKFKMCKCCNAEYKNVLNRRFHAQPNCCPSCGPQLELIEKYGNKVKTETPIKDVIRFIKEDKILSVKGIGGFHLVCNGKNESVIELLRKRKNRPTKPFAVMMKDIETVKKYCILSVEEELILSSNKRPIVILDKRQGILPNNIAPGNKTIGVMLPYTPLHYLLFDDGLDLLIMTSANINGMPIIYKNEEAIDKLVEIVDYHLMNNRDIYTSIDDSVVRVILGEERVLRRGRGYSPTYLKGEGFHECVSLGADLKNSFCFCKDETIILSQYVGDLENLETLSRHEKAMDNLRNIYNVKPKLIAYDFHPNFFSAIYAEKLEGKKIGVYHHHAHIASVLFENGIKDKVIGIAYDGVGYGEDGTLWGGEFLLANCKEFKRVGHLNLVAMPGGDRAAREPKRMAIAYLYKAYKENAENKIEELWNGEKYSKILFKHTNINKQYIEMIEKGINSPQTSSIGRLFDGVAYLLGFNSKITFEGEAAIYLENIADCKEVSEYDFKIGLIDRKYVINTDEIFIGIIEDLKALVSKEVISKKFHNTVIKFTVDLCVRLGEEYGIKKVALSGGVFQNKILLEGIYNSLRKKEFIVYINKQIPCNDGGISLGQMVVANEMEME